MLLNRLDVVWNEMNICTAAWDLKIVEVELLEQLRRSMGPFTGCYDVSQVLVRCLIFLPSHPPNSVRLWEPVVVEVNCKPVPLMK